MILLICGGVWPSFRRFGIDPIVNLKSGQDSVSVDGYELSPVDQLSDEMQDSRSIEQRSYNIKPPPKCVCPVIMCCPVCRPPAVCHGTPRRWTPHRPRTQSCARLKIFPREEASCHIDNTRSIRFPFDIDINSSTQRHPLYFRKIHRNGQLNPTHQRPQSQPPRHTRATGVRQHYALRCRDSRQITGQRPGNRSRGFPIQP